MLYPLQFRPVLRRYLWGGRRLQTVLGKPLPEGNDWAESWEVVDHGRDQSVVANGPLAGTSLGELVTRHGVELLGRHHPLPRFPLLWKFLDAQQTLSVQVHPNDAYAARLNPPDSGKTEAWVVLEAPPGSTIYAGLKPGVDREQLSAAIEAGTCPECLCAFQPSPGDCFFLPAGTVHALGAGLLVAELQQSGDTTYRLFDWNRLGPDGRPRALHVEQALEVIDFRPTAVGPQRPRPLDEAGTSRLVECDKFILDRCEVTSPRTVGDSNRCHIIAVLSGTVRISPGDLLLHAGSTALIPACVGGTVVSPQDESVVLDAFLP